MYDDQEIDALIAKAAQENKGNLADFGPDYSKIEREVLAVCKGRARKRKSAAVLRIAAASVAALLLVNAFLIFAEIEPVKAYREELKKLVFNIFSSRTDDSVETQYYKASTEIEKVQKLVPYHIPVPGWLPPDYAFDSIQMRNDDHDVYTVTLKYGNAGDILSVNVSNDASASNTVPSNDEGNYEKAEAGGNEVYIFAASAEGKTRVKCFFYDKQGLHVYISGSIDKQSLLDLIDSMK